METFPPLREREAYQGGCDSGENYERAKAPLGTLGRVPIVRSALSAALNWTDGRYDC